MLLFTEANQHKLSEGRQMRLALGLKQRHTRLTCQNSVSSDEKDVSQKENKGKQILFFNL